MNDLHVPNWQVEAMGIRVSAGTIIQVNRESSSSGKLIISIDQRGPFCGWGYCKLLIHLVECSSVCSGNTMRKRWFSALYT